MSKGPNNAQTHCLGLRYVFFFDQLILQCTHLAFKGPAPKQCTKCIIWALRYVSFKMYHIILLIYCFFNQHSPPTPYVHLYNPQHPPPPPPCQWLKWCILTHCFGLQHSIILFLLPVIFTSFLTVINSFFFLFHGRVWMHFHHLRWIFGVRNNYY